MRFCLILAMAFVVLLCGCGGSNSSGLTISPSSASLSPGETQTFTITGARGIHAVDALRLTWDCSGGSFMFAGGLSATFTAGDEPGDYTVTASDGKLSGSASVSIR